MLKQLGDVHEVGQQPAEALERAAEAEHLRKRLCELGGRQGLSRLFRHPRGPDRLTRAWTLHKVLEDVARLGARLVLQAALEAEVTEFLGRERYARGERARAGSRNGHHPVTVKTTAGPVGLERPKLRGTDTAFASRLLGKHVTRTNALESLTIAGYVRGLSTRDVEASLADALGSEATLSKSTVSRVCEAIRSEFDQWGTRDLSDIQPEYLYLDASHFLPRRRTRRAGAVRLGHHHRRAAGVRGVQAASAESTDAGVGFLRDLGTRGLRAPLLVITDGAPGLIAAVEQVLPDSLRQRCLIPPRPQRVEPRSAWTTTAPSRPTTGAIFDDIDARPGQPALAQVRDNAARFADTWDEVTQRRRLRHRRPGIADDPPALPPASIGAGCATTTWSSAPSASPAAGSR